LAIFLVLFPKNQQRVPTDFGVRRFSAAFFDFFPSRLPKERKKAAEKRRTPKLRPRDVDARQTHSIRRTSPRDHVNLVSTSLRGTSDDAYMLASLAVDFSITQLVDGTVGVHGMIPKGIFKKK
jgi:acetamidase/formamidase